MFTQFTRNIGVLRIIIWRIFICDVIDLANELECQKQFTIIDVEHFEFRWSRITRNCCKKYFFEFLLSKKVLYKDILKSPCDENS